jgi:hypothetical protein
VVAKLHLVSWTGVVIGGLKIGELFGINRTSIEKSATLHPEWCGRIDAKAEPGTPCSDALSDVLFRSDEVAQSLLGCIALYVLPALYGCLGAAAATFRMLRSKVDRSLVSVTDRGRVMQDIVLGLLCGAIIGLFIGYIGKATPDLGLGLSALALLAGYNVSNKLLRTRIAGGASFRLKTARLRSASNARPRWCRSRSGRPRESVREARLMLFAGCRMDAAGSGK